MNLGGYFGKDLFTHLKDTELRDERVKAEKMVERLSQDIESLQERIQNLMLQSKGKSYPIKLLNIQKIKALKMETASKEQEAEHYIKRIQLILLVEAMREHKQTEGDSKLLKKLTDMDVEKLQKNLLSDDMKEAIKEGKIDDVRERLRNLVAREDMPQDAETHELLNTIDDLEHVDEETALKMAGEKAKKVTESTAKMKATEDE